MAVIIDTSLWIDLTRARSPRVLKAFVAAYVNNAAACLAAPVVFEVLRFASDVEFAQLTRQFETMPLLANPSDLWSRGAKMGRACRRAGVNAGALDLLIAAVAVYHSAELVTFDADFVDIGRVVGMDVALLHRPQR